MSAWALHEAQTHQQIKARGVLAQSARSSVLVHSVGPETGFVEVLGAGRDS